MEMVVFSMSYCITLNLRGLSEKKDKCIEKLCITLG